MFPGVSPGAVGEGIANPVVADRDSVVRSQQVAPVIVVGVGRFVSDSVNCLYQLGG